jgi:hypothetical protein
MSTQHMTRRKQKRRKRWIQRKKNQVKTFTQKK